MGDFQSAGALAELAASLDVAQRNLLARYLSNALANPDRRAVRAGNARFSALVSSSAAVLPLFAAAGFVQSKTADGVHYTVPVGTAADSSLRNVLSSLEQAAPSLLSLPDELQHRVLGELGAEDLSALQRVSKGSARMASYPALWLKFCPPKFWRMARAAGIDSLGFERWAAAAPIGFATQARHRAAAAAPATQSSTRGGGGGAASASLSIDWQLVYRMVNSWERLRSRCGAAVSFSLRDGVSLETLSRAPPALLRRMPAALIASLLVQDGQIASGDGSVGLLFAGARLLSFDEIAEAALAGEGAFDEGLPITTQVGFQRLAVRADGRVVMCAGFNTHVKAKSLAAFLELVLVDTV